MVKYFGYRLTSLEFFFSISVFFAGPKTMNVLFSVSLTFSVLYSYSARTQSNTCLIDALEHAYTTALDSRYGGRRGYKNVEQDIILISDGLVA